jgi:hypothetical protein
MVLGSTQPLTEMSTRDLPRGKDGQLTISPPYVRRLFRKRGNLDDTQPYRPPRSVTGIALLFLPSLHHTYTHTHTHTHIYIYIYSYCGEILHFVVINGRPCSHSSWEILGVSSSKGKGKIISVQALEALKVARSLGPIFLGNRLIDGGIFVSPKHRSLFTSRKNPGNHSC